MGPTHHIYLSVEGTGVSRGINRVVKVEEISIILLRKTHFHNAKALDHHLMSNAVISISFHPFRVSIYRVRVGRFVEINVQVVPV